MIENTILLVATMTLAAIVLVQFVIVGVLERCIVRLVDTLNNRQRDSGDELSESDS